LSFDYGLNEFDMNEIYTLSLNGLD